MGHRVELSYGDATKGVTIHQKLQDLLLGMFYFYHNSPLNRSNLKVTAEALGIPVYLPTRVGGTRWLSHTLTALTNLLKGYPAFVEHLGQVSDVFSTQASTLTQNDTGPVGSLTPSICRSCKFFTGPILSQI